MDKAPEAFRIISEVADDLNVPQHVLRFWESRFPQIKPMKRGGGRRYYRPDDIDLLRGIRHLLYGEGYTIRGVQRILKDHGVKFVQTVWQAGSPQPSKAVGDIEETEALGEPGESERARGLFGLLPAFLGSAEPGSAAPAARREPAIEDMARQPPAANENGHQPGGAQTGWSTHARAADPSAREHGAISGPGVLGREDLARLQATLSELIECKRLLDEVLTEQS